MIDHSYIPDEAISSSTYINNKENKVVAYIISSIINKENTASMHSLIDKNLIV